ncbi:hypothetical protein CDCA_CDCA10G2853 [Cyanidium caldarium]|uniref:Histone-lysine N-methyltransferase n=1 Tax=Cyanidium caldarium TaxID=2771 RepID=A0AAV9IXK5_CYACA|nr:hypothetical protein CDCA_CDCA10G2853 [Cyanidium caldarium]
MVATTTNGMAESGTGIPGGEEPACGLCGRAGDQPCGEGRLLGPFAPKPPAKRSFWVHEQCARYSAECEEVERLEFTHLAEAVRRGRSIRCSVCRRPGGTITCAHGRPRQCWTYFHFRCAVLSGAGVVRGAAQVYCAVHREQRVVAGVLSATQLLYRQVPLAEELERCRDCRRKGMTLRAARCVRCSACGARLHWMCAGLRRDESLWEATSRYHWCCVRCKRCEVCGEGVREPTAPSMVYCDGCDRGYHVRCLPESQQQTLRRGPFLGRCCTPQPRCVSCEQREVEREGQYCERCVEAQRRGDACCVCQRAFLVDAPVSRLMVCCDVCSRWADAECWRLTPEERQRLVEQPDARYVCPDCGKKEERRRRQQRRCEEQRVPKRPRAAGTDAAEALATLDWGFGDVEPPWWLARVKTATTTTTTTGRQNGKTERKRPAHGIYYGASEAADPVTARFPNRPPFSPDIECCAACGDTMCVGEGVRCCAYCGEAYHRRCSLRGESEPADRWRCAACGGAEEDRRQTVSTEIALPRWAFRAPPTECVLCGGELAGAAERLGDALLCDTCTRPAAASKEDTGEAESLVMMNGDGVMTRAMKVEVDERAPDVEFRYLREVVRVADTRHCVRCGQRGDCSTRAWRLLGVSGADGLTEWVHAVCAACAEGVEVDTERGELVGVAATRCATCTVCGGDGAAFRCAYWLCDAMFHVPCAIRNRCAYRHGRLLQAFCAAHRDLAPGTLIVQLSALHWPEVEGVWCARRPISDGELAGAAGVRVGALTVLDVGEVVYPDAPAWRSGGVIVPRGLLVARRYWSVVRPGARTLYFLSVTEDRDCRPLFRLRCGDDPQLTLYGHSAAAVWRALTRRVTGLPPDARLGGDAAFGLAVPEVRALLAQLPRATRIGAPPLNPSGAARTEPYRGRRSALEKWTFLAPVHRSVEVFERRDVPSSGGGEAPLAPQIPVAEATGVPPAVKATYVIATATAAEKQQYRQMQADVRATCIPLRSRIAGFGLFALRDLEPETFVIEYAGECIAAPVSDVRERYYNRHGIGCYMFRIDEETIVDATEKGNGARFINHSCEPNCYSRIYRIGGGEEAGRQVIVILTARAVKKGEELTYHYNLSSGDDDDTAREPCHCGAASCTGYMT